MGYFRFSMMLAVVYYHVVQPAVSAYLAVFGFWVLSGYVITLVSAEFYRGGWHAKGMFLLNRAVRIYPTYLACLVISLLGMWATGFTTAIFHYSYTLPDNGRDWLYQFTIIGLSNTTPERCPARLLPPAWSLGTEMVYYLCIGLITGASRRLTLLAFAAAIVSVAVMLDAGLTFKYFYLTIYGPASRNLPWRCMLSLPPLFPKNYPSAPLAIDSTGKHDDLHSGLYRMAWRTPLHAPVLYWLLVSCLAYSLHSNNAYHFC